MIINGINFPDDLIKSIQNNELVVFAGAGVSMGKPTCLPDFAKLTRLIAKDTGHNLLRRKDYEVFLGELKNNWGSGDGPDVNSLAAEILSKTCKEPNDLHRALINLFEHPEDIKIVTTNYDQMFEVETERLGYPVKIYDVPALPLGDDVTGIVHLHGNINNPRYIVLTDEDFGRAYLTDGYASRFLVQLFTQYDVLFVGYSLNDTVLRYLTKAMSRVSNRNKYILTDNKDGKWKSLNIVNIDFPYKEYDTMTKAVALLGEQARMSMLQWKDFFCDIKDAPPKDLTKESIVSFCLKDEDKTKIMIQIISGESWVSILDEKGIFNNIFSRTDKLSNEEYLWMGWLSKNIVGKDIFFKMMAKHKGVINIEFAENLLFNLIKNEKEILDDMFQKQIILLIDDVNEEHYLYSLLEIADKRNLITLYWLLFKKLFQFKLITVNRYSLIEGTAFAYEFSTDEYTLANLWKKREKDLVEIFSISILNFCVDFVETLHDNYVLLDEANSEEEPWRVSRYPLENRDITYLFDGLYVVSDIFLAASLGAEAINPESLRGILFECLKSDSVFLRKMALISLRETSVYTPSQKYQILIKNNCLSHRFEIQQTKKLVCSIFDKLSIGKKLQLIDKIENASSGSDFEKARFTYNYLHALKQNCHPLPYIIERMKQLDEQYDLSAAANPSRPTIDKRFQMNCQDILKLDEKKLNELFSFVCSNSNSPYYYELMDEITKAAEIEYTWTYKAIQLILHMRIKDEELWKHMLYGVEKMNIGIQEHYDLIKLLVNPLVLENNNLEMSRVFLKFMRLDNIGEFFLHHEDEIYSLFTELWKYKKNEAETLGILEQSLNSSIGLLVYSCIHMIDCHKERNIPEKYKTFLINCLSMKGQGYYISLCVMVGHYGFFHFRDELWCRSSFDPILCGEHSDEEYTCAWDGFIFYTGGFNTDYARNISSVFLKATAKMDLLSNESHDRFIALYVTLLIHVVRRPGSNYIPRFFKYASDEDKRYFVSTIGHRLKNMESNKKVGLWKRWLKQHLINRTNNKPMKPNELELQEYLNWLPYLQEVFDEAVDIICNGLLPESIDVQFFDGLIKNQLPQIKPISTCHLLICLCENGSKPQFGYSYAKKVVSMFDKLPSKESLALENALIQSGWRKI